MPTSIFYPKGGGDKSLPVYHELADDYVFVDVPSVELGVAAADLWDPAQADTIIYEVYFEVVNNDAGGEPIGGIYIGREIDSGGGLAAPYYWMFNEALPPPGKSGWQGPYYIHGDDAIRGNAGVANDASVHFRVRRVL